MTYIPDLTFCTYGPTPYGPLLAIGWLNGEYEYPKGKAPAELIQKLATWAGSVEDTAVNWTRGLHDCNLETVEHPVNHEHDPAVFANRGRYALNNGEFHVFHKGIFYASPTMLYTYIVDYDYLPPQVFIDAVLSGELITKENQDSFSPFGAFFPPSLAQEEQIRMSTWIMQAQAELDSGAEKNALEKLEQVLEIQPWNQEALFMLANYFQAKADHLKLIEILDQFLKFYPNADNFYAYRGENYFQLKQYEAAKKDFELILSTARFQGAEYLGEIEQYLNDMAG